MTTVEYAWVERDPASVPGGMPAARLALLVQDESESCMLWTFAADGSHAGDTFHLSRAAAEEQAAHDFGDRLGEWNRVSWSPRGARDEARKLLAATRNRTRSRRISQAEAYRLAENEEQLLRFERTYGRSPRSRTELQDAYDRGKLTPMVFDGDVRLKPSAEAHRRVRDKFIVEGET